VTLVGCHDDTTSNILDSSVDSGVDAASDGDAIDSLASDTSDALTPSEAAPLATSAGKDEDPTLIRAADGTFHLMWYSDRDGRDDLYLKSSKDGRTWSADRNVTADDAHDFYPSLIQAKDGRFHLVWWRGDKGATAIGIVGSIWTMSSLDLVTWTKPFALTDATAIAWVPTIAERVPGELVVAWSTDASGDKDIWTRASKNGGVDWESPRKITDAAFNDDLPFVVARGDGSLLLAWQRYDASVKTFEAAFGDPSNDLVYATSSDGTTWSTPVAITSDTPASASPDVIVGLFPSKDASGWSAAWATTRAPASAQSDILALGLSKAPATASNVVLLTNGKERGYSPRLVPVDASGRYLMVWVSNGGGTNLDIWSRFIVP